MYQKSKDNYANLNILQKGSELFEIKNSLNPDFIQFLKKILVN